MKKLLSILFIGFTIMAMQSQEISDALRFSQNNLNGTARFRAMSGAFGALGGDLSSVGMNPAGSAVFINNQLGLTLTYYHTNNKSDYFGSKYSEKNNDLDLNQMGAVFVFDNQNRDSDWKKLSMGINYENTNNFDNKSFIVGNNPTNSVAQYFINEANGIPADILEKLDYDQLNFREQQAFLAYETYIIENTEGTDNYYSNMAGKDNYHQESSMSSTGYNGKLSFNFATQYKDWLYLGINLNNHFINYLRSTSFYEDTYDSTTGTGKGIEELRYNNDLYTYGNGFSFQLGAIAKLTDNFRFGLSYQSPTWYSLNDELRQTMASFYPSRDDGKDPNIFYDLGITNIYPAYKLQSPEIYTGSFAYIFGRNGLISVDYALRDYSNTKFNPGYNFSDLNKEMSDILQLTSELRIGGEYRIENVSLRGGYRHEQSPYKNRKTIGDLQGFSAGLGFNFGSTKLDFAYSHSKRDYNQPFFSTGLTDSATVKTINNNVSVSLLFEL